MIPLFIGAGVVAAGITIYVVVRLSTKDRKRHYHRPRSGPRACGRHTGPSSGSTTSSTPATSDSGAGHYSFTHYTDAPRHDHDQSHDHTSHHYTPEAPSSSYGGDIGSVDSSSSCGDSGGGGGD